GNQGRGLLDSQEISLATHTAFTQQWRTCYLFNTALGQDAFLKLFERTMDALLHPDYNDEEIRREVRNFGIVENAATKKLGLEEKGAVYNEMVSSFTQPQRLVSHHLSLALYGKGHPLANVAGGLPAAMGALTPDHIRKFHGDTYHLGNMG